MLDLPSQIQRVFSPANINNSFSIIFRFPLVVRFAPLDKTLQFSKINKFSLLRSNKQEHALPRELDNVTIEKNTHTPRDFSFHVRNFFPRA